MRVISSARKRANLPPAEEKERAKLCKRRKIKKFANKKEFKDEKEAKSERSSELAKSVSPKEEGKVKDKAEGKKTKNEKSNMAMSIINAGIHNVSRQLEF